MNCRTVPIAFRLTGMCLSLLCIIDLVQAGETFVLTLKKKTQDTKRVQVAGTELDLHPYQFAEVLLTNTLDEPLELEYNTGIGEVASRGCNFGYARSPSSLKATVLIDPGASRKFELRMPLETVPPEKLKSGVYYLRVQLHHKGKVWESNEIEIDHK
jgi:hypothetical protein